MMLEEFNRRTFELLKSTTCHKLRDMCNLPFITHLLQTNLIRTISGEYLVTKKLMAFRQHKHDFSDIVGILREHARAGDPLTYERIDTAVVL